MSEEATELRQLVSKGKALTQENINLKANINPLGRENAELKEKVDCLEKSNAELIQQAKEAAEKREAELNRVTHDIERSASALKKKEGVCKSQKDSIARLKEQLQGARATIASLAREKTRVAQILEVVVKDLEEESILTERQKDSIMSLEKERDNVSKDLDKKSRLLGETAQYGKEFLARISVLEKDLSQARSNLEACSQEKTTLLRDADTRIAELERDKTNLSGRLDISAKSLGDQTQLARQNEVRIAELEEKLNKISEERKELKRKLDGETERSQSLTAQVAALEEQKNDIRDAKLKMLEESNEQCELYKKQISDMHNKLATAELEIDKLRKDIEDLEGKIYVMDMNTLKYFETSQQLLGSRGRATSGSVRRESDEVSQNDTGTNTSHPTADRPTSAESAGSTVRARSENGRIGGGISQYAPGLCQNIRSGELPRPMDLVSTTASPRLSSESVQRFAYPGSPVTDGYNNPHSLIPPNAFSRHNPAPPPRGDTMVQRYGHNGPNPYQGAEFMAPQGKYQLRPPGYGGNLSPAQLHFLQRNMLVRQGVPAQQRSPVQQPAMYYMN